MIQHLSSSLHRRLVLLACGLASALSGLAVAVSPSGVEVAGDAAALVAGEQPGLPEGLAGLLTASDRELMSDTVLTADAVLAASEEQDSTELTYPPAEASPGYRVVWMEVTAYCACTHCCGPNAQGITASGRPVSHNRGRFVAADTRLLPFHTKLSIPGYHGGELVPVLDRGGAIKGNKLDVYFDSHQTAKEWGRRWLPVRVYE